jgi:hypothetical protein
VTRRSVAETRPSDQTEPSSERRQTVAGAMAAVETITGRHFPDLVDAVKACLAVAAVGCLSDNAQPTTVIFVAPPSAGKSMALNFLMPAGTGDPLAAYFYRSDKFTEASFVSHRADSTPEKLAKVDLLPRLKNKTLLTKELAPQFSGRREELESRFAVLAAVLDGQGYVSDSGAHGRRGYDEPINFQWLGATTPLLPEVLKVMAKIGPRMVFYDADRPRKRTHELAALVRGANDGEAKAKCRAAVRDFLTALYEQHPPRSVPSERVAIGDSAAQRLALWAQTLVALRATVEKSEQSEGEERDLPPPVLEHPERILTVLQNVAIGSALAHGRREVADYDLAQVAHIALSSGIAGRQRTLRALLGLQGSATTPQLEARTGMTSPTTRRYMRELAAVGLARLTDGSPSRIDLAEAFRELCDAPMLKAK